MGTNRELIESAIAPLLQRGFVNTGTKESTSIFGDVEVQLKAPDAKLRLTSDRSQIFVDIAPPDAARWYDLKQLLAYALNVTTLPRGPWSSPAEAIATFLRFEPSILDVLRRADLLVGLKTVL